MNIYYVTIAVEVWDAEALYDAAIKHATTVDGLDSAAATAALTLDDRSIDEGACIQTLLDPGISPPGTKIIESVVEPVHV